MLTEQCASRIESLSGVLASIRPGELSRLIDSRRIVEDPRFSEWAEERHASFYAPFDWINEQADILLIGITPGMQQAEAALLALQSQLAKGATVEAAARAAKNVASFKGEMREIGARLIPELKGDGATCPNTVCSRKNDPRMENNFRRTHHVAHDSSERRIRRDACVDDPTRLKVAAHGGTSTSRMALPPHHNDSRSQNRRDYPADSDGKEKA